MIEFLLALLVFLAAHSIPARPAVRSRFVAALGERPYLVLYSLLSIGLLAWLISAAVRAPVTPLWPTSLFTYYLALALMLPANWLLIGGLLTPNPVSISFRRRSFDPTRPGLVAVTRHPVLWGFALWALLHTIANGDLVSLIMFGGLLLFSLAGMRLLDRRRRRQLGEGEWRRLRESGRRWSAAQLLTTFGGGTLFYFAALHLHPLWGPDVGALLF
ncbi:NnrU family protein [Sphingomonas sp. GCM10030256]|uniref:NnrU family protein n=1 Tax=Sphingomonas sp. GCM10030256 TaxID=3273427 RepID=UPI00361ECC37